LSGLRVAHIVLAHKNLEQVNTFVRQIESDGYSDVYIHADAKCPDLTVGAIATETGAKVLPARVSVNWGDFTMIEATLKLLRAVQQSGKVYDFVLLNSGQDLLVRAGLHEHLAANKDRIFLSARKIAPDDPQNDFWRLRWPRAARNRYDFLYHPHRLMRAGLFKLCAIRLNVRPNPCKLPPGWSLYRASQWWCVPGRVADEMLAFLGRNRGYCELFRDSLVPDEFFFTTLIMNSPHAAQVTGENLTYLNFGKTRRDHNHPVSLTVGEARAVESSGRFFARKFDPAVDAEVIRYFSAKYGA
jgi:hypothetical protein